MKCSALYVTSIWGLNVLYFTILLVNTLEKFWSSKRKLRDQNEIYYQIKQVLLTQSVSKKT